MSKRPEWKSRKPRFAFLALSLMVLAPAADAAATVPIPISGHVLPALDQALPLARRAGAADAPMTLTLVLRRKDEAGFQQLLKDLYDPASPRFRKFLTSREISDRFGPTQADYDSVKAYFEQQGFMLSAGSANRGTLTLRGTRAQAERALSVTIGDYTLGDRGFYANDADPALPPELASKVEAIAGLSDLGTPRHAPLLRVLRDAFCIVYAVIHLFVMVVQNGAENLNDLFNLVREGFNLCLKAFPVPGGRTSSNRIDDPYKRNDPYNSMEFRSRLPVDRPDGTGQTIGLVQFDTFHTSDVSDFLALIGAPASRIDDLSQVPVNGGATLGANESEVLLDIDVTMGLAPGARVVVFDAPQSTSWQTMFNAMIDEDVTVISNSWSTCENEHSLADVQSIDSVLQTAAAAGISVFNASGDTGSTCLNGSPGTVGVPAGSPNATAVGGTSLSSAAGYVYGGETWWQDKGGFGVSRFFPRPGYQNGLTGAAMRSVPDVAIVADPNNGMLICQASQGGCPTGLSYGGTSMSAPIWAAYAALLNDSQGANLGAFNLAIYPLANAGAFHTAASMGSDFAHVGLGSPNLDVLDRLLAGQTIGVPDAGLSAAFHATTRVGELEMPLPLEIPADGTSSATVCVTLRDANGHTVSGKTVTLAASSGSDAVISPASGVTSESNGAVVFTVTDLTPETVTFTATDTTDNIILPQTASLTFVVPSAASGGITAFPLTVPATGSSPATITITLKDALDRPSPGKRISISQGSGHSVLTGPVPQVTDANGQIQFTVTNGVSETVTYTAVDETDGLPIPGSASVDFDGSSTSCVAVPAAAEGFALTPFANGFEARNFFYSNVNWGGCPGASNPAFGADGSVFIAGFTDGSLYKLGPGGGTISGDNKLATLGPTLFGLTFAPDGRLYAAHGATGGGFSTGDIVQIDPATGAVLRTVASGLTCPSFAIDPLSGDIFIDDICFGSAANPSVWRIHDPDGNDPAVTVYATLPDSAAGTMSFAPDGTLYVPYAYISPNPSLARIDGTDKPSPPTVTTMAGIKPVYWARVAQAQEDGSAKSLIIHSGTALQLVDLTTDPYTFTDLGTGGIGSGVTGPDGCLYTSGSDTVYKLSQSGGGCGFLPSNPGPTLSLSPSSVSPDPAQGSSQTFTATFRNVSVPAGTLVYFQVSGVNAQPKLARTDANGVATIRYTGLMAGTDTIKASGSTGPAAGSLDLVSNAVRVTWTAAEIPALGLVGAALAATALLALAAARTRARREGRVRPRST